MNNILLVLNYQSAYNTASFYVAVEFFAIIIVVVVFLIIIGAILRFRGPLARTEGIRRRPPSIGIIKSSDGAVTFEPMIEHSAGILVSLSKHPLFGHFYIATEGATIRPKTTSPIHFIEARAGLDVNTEVVQAGDGLLGRLPMRRGPGFVLNSKDIEELLMDFAATYYYPSLTYNFSVQQYTVAEQTQLKASNPVFFNQWQNRFKQDQRNWYLWDIEKKNGISYLNELRTGVMRSVITIGSDQDHPSGFKDNVDGTVEPFYKETKAERKIRDDERLDWYKRMCKNLADWPDKLPAWVAGREVDFRNIGRWNILSPSADDLSRFEAKIIEIFTKKNKQEVFRILVIGLVVAMVIGVFGIVAYLLK